MASVTVFENTLYTDADITRTLDFSIADGLSVPSDFYLTCRTSLVNLGAISDWVPPTQCASQPPYSGVMIGSPMYFQCPEPLAYKSCMPQSSLASQWSAQTTADCERTYTYYSPALNCPTGWEMMVEVTSTGSDGVVSRPPESTWVDPWYNYPGIKGTHKMCCPR